MLFLQISVAIYPSTTRFLCRYLLQFALFSHDQTSCSAGPNDSYPVDVVGLYSYWYFKDEVALIMYMIVLHLLRDCISKEVNHLKLWYSILPFTFYHQLFTLVSGYSGIHKRIELLLVIIDSLKKMTRK